MRSGARRASAYVEAQIVDVDDQHRAEAFHVGAFEVGGGVGVPLALVDGEAVKRAVELPVPATIEAVSIALTGGGGDRGGAARARELRVGG